MRGMNIGPLMIAGILGAVGFASAGEPAPPPATEADRTETYLDRASKALKDIQLGPGTLDLGLSLRGRYEFLGDFNIKRHERAENDEVLLERVRLDFDYRIGEDFRAFVQIQDAHFWLSDFHVRDFEPSCPYQNPADLRQAFIEWHHIGGTPVGAEIGRQVLRYGDDRVLGPGDWGNAGRYTWDAIKGLLDVEPVALDVFFARRVEYDPHHFDDEHFDFDVVGAYARVKNLPLDVDAFWLYKIDEHGRMQGERGRPGDERRHTVGVHVDGAAAERFDYGGTIACQVGDFGRDDIRAYGLNARAGWTFDTAWQPRLGAELTYASGDHDPTDGRHETFDGVFGAGARYYGRMNLFAWKNLEDYQTGLSVTPVKGLKVALDYHFFRLAEAKDAWYYGNGKAQRCDVTGDAGDTLGHELDLIARYKLSDHLTLMGGYAHFFPGPFVSETGSSEDADWFFLQFELSI